MTAPLPRSVRRVLEAMQANVGHRRSVSELASVAGVSSRTLQRQFTSFLGKSPQAMQHEIGLELDRDLGVDLGSMQARDAMVGGAREVVGRHREVALAAFFWPHGAAVLFGLAIFHLIALVLTGIPLLREVRKEMSEQIEEKA